MGAGWRERGFELLIAELQRSGLGFLRPTAVRQALEERAGRHGA